MYQIVENLFQGDRLDSITSSDDFDIIINCTKEIPFYNNKDISENNLIRLPIVDDSSKSNIDLFNNLDLVVQKINIEIENNKKILVHCKYGQQRSCTVIVCYLMNKYKWNMNYTINFMKCKNPNSFKWGINFIDSIKMWNNLINKEKII